MFWAALCAALASALAAADMGTPGVCTMTMAPCGPRSVNGTSPAACSRLAAVTAPACASPLLCSCAAPAFEGACSHCGLGRPMLVWACTCADAG